MTLGDIKDMVMFQTNNDKDDLGDFLPYLETYINDGYDRLTVAYAGEHSGADSDTYPPLRNDKASPELPDWCHHAIADWATWLVYRNGNVQKQNRGYQFRSAFSEVEGRLRGMTSTEKGVPTSSKRYFINLPR
jgi:hypothetical protein